MTTAALTQEIKKKQSFLCIGLDVDMDKIPKFLLETDDPIFEFNKAIIDATHDLCVAYKPNTAFYESYGVAGWKALERTIRYLNDNYPQLFTIADAKRGDIGNTSTMYAKAFFENMNFNAVTVAPYMGRDSVEPFLAFDNKHTILLALTSNAGAFDFQMDTPNKTTLYKDVLKMSKHWENAQNLMYVVGATKAEYLAEVRQIVPTAYLLVPGVGAQGGSLEAVCEYGMTPEVGLLVNSSRNILYASNGTDFSQAARAKAAAVQAEMTRILKRQFQ